jgi:DNA-binding transcriptional LysR family regulator
LRPTIDSRLQLAAIVLAEELHYGRAAQKLHIAVSTLSKQIVLLEKKLGMILFVRNPKVVAPTEAGRAYVAEAHAGLLHAKKASNVARAANEGLEHILTAGRTPYTDPALVSMLLSIDLPLYPNIKVQLHSDFGFHLVRALLAGKLDVALVACIRPSSICTTGPVTGFTPLPAPASASLVGSIALASEASLLLLVPTLTVFNQMCEK